MRIHPSTLVSAALITVSVLLVAGCGSSQPRAGESAAPDGAAPTHTPSWAPSSTVSPVDGNPLQGRRLWVDPGSKAAQAVPTLSGEDARIVSRLAQTPTGIWLTPEATPTGTVAPAVAAVMAAAGDAVPLFVIYGIPQRDCTGGHSSGGLDAIAYLDWIRSIASAFTRPPLVILEPDALASAPACNLVPQREELLSAALGILAERATVYLDAGHSSWIEPATMATMLSLVGVERARGFAVNVSSYGADTQERAYADALRAALPPGAGTHYVIDSSRNGNGGNGEWCNPTGRALGTPPGAASGDNGDTGLDAHLWVKPPGESDGTCQGGPAAGTFWPEQALSLARAAGW